MWLEGCGGLKAVVLSSGGVDSTTCLALAVQRLGAEHVSTVSIYYGQKHERELECARKIGKYYQVPHYEFDIARLMQYSNCSLLKGSTQEIVHKSYAEQIAENGMGKVSTYVPFRNGLMLSIAASFAGGIYEDEETELYIGAHADDAAGNAYADCGKPFMDAMGKAVEIGSYGLIHITAPFVGMSKAEVVRTGLGLQVPYELTWSCYESGDVPCGTCGTCIDRAKAFAANGVSDPALPQG